MSGPPTMGRSSGSTGLPARPVLSAALLSSIQERVTTSRIGQGVGRVGNMVGGVVGDVAGEVGAFAKKNIIEKIDITNRRRRKVFADDDEDIEAIRIREEQLMRQNEEEVLASLPQEYFTENYDSVTGLLVALPGDVDDAYIATLISNKEDVLSVVNQKLFNKVMANYNQFVQAMTSIHDLGVDIKQSTSSCKAGRQTLRTLQEALAFGAINILDNFKRRQTWEQVLQDLDAIQELQRVEVELKKTLAAGQYPETISLCLDVRDMVQYCTARFTCALDLDRTLQSIYQVVQERLDNALFETCRSWNAGIYEKVLSAHRLLGKTSYLAEKLQPLFVEQIESECKNIILAHALLSEEAMMRAETLKKLQAIRELCTHVKGEHFTNCLLTVLEYLTDLMLSHYEMSSWHEVHKDEPAIAMALAKFTKAMWDRMQRQVSIMVDSVNFSSFKIDDFLKFLDGIAQFLEIGEAFGGSAAFKLRTAVTASTKTYFEAFHRSRLEDLRTMLDNENWNKVPVTPTFTVLDVKEFRAALTILDNAIYVARNERQNIGTYGAVFVGLRQTGNPFSGMIQYATRRRGPLVQTKDDDSDDEAPELFADSVEEDDTPTIKRKTQQGDARGGPVLANTTINVVRTLAKYLHMMKTLQHISPDVFAGTVQLVEYYVFSVYSFFWV
eukprot:TRINITY_DN5190_c0_g1_i1.p1 TRINITY_DN5190_c0_g1~~TRINITY_DN5190_c0_g1_i1.p1  ORF type:complete len:682 (-),score=197.18 TRINITY_DN5190_c0_g1_i1:960-2966(-)